MSNPDTKAPQTTEMDDLKLQCAALQRQVNWLLLTLSVLSVTVCVFLWRQARYAHTDLEAIRQPATQIIQAFKTEKPRMDSFVSALGDYGKTHPDFAPILNKYQIVPNAAAANPATPAAATPAPKTAPAAPAKK